MTDPARPANEITGDVYGQTVQAGSIHRDVYFQQAADIGPVIPRQLLPPPGNFANRHHEVSTLDDLLTETGDALTVVVLRGPGGVGKPDGQLYADLTRSDGEPVLADDILGQFLRALGLAPQRVPGGLVRKLEKRMLHGGLTRDTRVRSCTKLNVNGRTARDLPRKTLVRVCIALSAFAVLVMFGGMSVLHSQIWDPFIAG